MMVNIVEPDIFSAVGGDQKQSKKKSEDGHKLFKLPET